jgi:hypothetical protein
LSIEAAPTAAAVPIRSEKTANQKIDEDINELGWSDDTAAMDQNEFDLYLAEPTLDCSDVIEFWKVNALKFPRLHN